MAKTLTPGTAEQAGLSRSALYRATQDGRYERITRGIYLPSDAGPASAASAVCLASVVPAIPKDSAPIAKTSSSGSRMSYPYRTATDPTLRPITASDATVSAATVATAATTVPAVTPPLTGQQVLVAITRIAPAVTTWCAA